VKKYYERLIKRYDTRQQLSYSLKFISMPKSVRYYFAGADNNTHSNNFNIIFIAQNNIDILSNALYKFKNITNVSILYTIVYKYGIY
jgi:hypothetical protein